MRIKHSYEVNEYAFFEVPQQRSLTVIIGLVMFGLSVVVYLLDVILSWGRFSPFLLLLAFVLFVLVPLATKKTNRYNAIVVTPEYLIQRTARNEFTAIRFDDVTEFKLTNSGIFISAGRHTVVLALTMFREEIDPIIDILEAKGKTFDPEKEFMIRPVKILIQDNKITLEDVQETTKSDLVYATYADKYLMLTPGYLESILLRNSNVTGFGPLKDDVLPVRFDRFEVKEGHPENTTFDSVIGLDCILVFHQPKITKALRKNPHNPDEEDTDLTTDFKQLQKHMVNAVVTEWKVGKNHIDLLLGSGVHSITLGISYSDVITGWNKTKE
jgi:hypothetical protein